jgi:hypothetical protein
MSMMIFVLIILERGEPTGQEFYFQELTSALSTATHSTHSLLAASTNFSATTDTFLLTVQYERYLRQMQVTKYCFVIRKRQRPNES